MHARFSVNMSSAEVHVVRLSIDVPFKFINVNFVGLGEAFAIFH